MMEVTICYKLKNPIVYNKGTKWESSCDTFLAWIVNGTKEEAQRRVNKLNTEHPAYPLGHYNPMNWDNIAYFYVSEQPDDYFKD